MDGPLSDEGVVLVGRLGDEKPQGCVGGKDAVVPVAVDVGWKEDVGCWRGGPATEDRSPGVQMNMEFFGTPRR